MTYKVLIYDIEGVIVNSKQYEQEPNEELMNDLLIEDEAVKGEVYSVEADEYSTHLYTYEFIF